MSKLNILRDNNFITDFCFYFAKFISELNKDHSEILEIVASLTSASVLLHQNIYFELEEIKSLPENIVQDLPTTEEIIKELKQSKVIGDVESNKPLILEDKRIYLNKYYQYEKLTAKIIMSFIKNETSNPVSIEKYIGIIDQLFGNDTKNQQRQAAISAINNNFFVLTGGPGTGKTTTVAKILLTLLKITPELQIAICAPTGKAAARLQNSIQSFLEREKSLFSENSIFNGLLDKFPKESTTIHGLLKSKFPSPKFHYNKDNFLPYDLIVIDEASMISLPLFYKLISAIKPTSKIILIGDKNQLSSVEPGNVFGDICKFILTSNLNCLVELTKNYRFGEESGIYSISNFVNKKDINKISQFLSNNIYKDITFNELPQKSDEFIKILESRILKYFTDYFNFKAQNDDDLLKKYHYLEKFIILSDIKNASFGKNNINYIIENIIIKNFGFENIDWYDGKIIIITQNDYNTKLYNGDVGYVDGDYFIIKSGSEINKIHRYRLPEYESAYALTIHKSQGSEYDNVMMILGTQESKVLTTELIYTGITRARKFVEIWSDKKTFISGVKKEIDRRSGLLEKLSKF